MEKKLNTQAGNGYFGNKKIKYVQSSISDVYDLGNSAEQDWTKENIEKRENNFINRIITYFEAQLNPKND